MHQFIDQIYYQRKSLQQATLSIQCCQCTQVTVTYRYNEIWHVSVFCKNLKSTNSLLVANNFIQKRRTILFNPKTDNCYRLTLYLSQIYYKINQ